MPPIQAAAGTTPVPIAAEGTSEGAATAPPAPAATAETPPAEATQPPPPTPTPTPTPAPTVAATTAPPTSPPIVPVGATAVGGPTAERPTATAPPIAAAGSPNPTVGPPVGVTDHGYQSPTYGYRLTWDPTWRVESATSASGRDALRLTNGVSVVTVEGYRFTGELPACVKDAAARYQPAQPGGGPLTSAPDEAGASSLGSAPIRAYARYPYAVTTTSGTMGFDVYVECRPAGGDAVVVLIQEAPRDAASDQATARSELLANLKTDRP